MNLDYSQALFASEYIEMNPTAGESLPLFTKKDAKGAFAASVVKDISLFHSGLGVCEDRTIIKDCLLNDYYIQLIFSQDGNTVPPECDLIELKGDYVSLVGPWCGGFWHWIMEYLPRLILAELAGFSGKFLIPPISGFVVESLLLLNINPERLVVFNTNKCVKVSNLLVLPRYGYIPREIYLSSLNLLREKMLEHVMPLNRPDKRVYLSRRKARNGRNVVNESDLLDVLEQYHFEYTEFDDMPLKEQISVMANANWLVGPHGAGFVHTLFMPRKSNVIELFSPNYINLTMLGAVELLQHRYHMLVPRNEENYRYGRDIFAPLEAIRVTIENGSDS